MSFSRSTDYDATDSRYGGLSSDKPQPKSNFDISLYHELCDSISCNIFIINSNVIALEKASKNVGTQADSPLLREKIHAMQLSTKELVGSTVRFLKELTILVTKGGEVHRLLCERIQEEFKATLLRYDTLQKQLDPKRGHTMLQSQTATKNTCNIAEGDEHQSLMDAERIQQEQQIQEGLKFEQELLLEREEHIRRIESDIRDVHKVFRDLALIVHDQDDQIDIIDVKSTAMVRNVEKGTKELEKAKDKKNSYRKKRWCFILILVVAVAVAILKDNICIYVERIIFNFGILFQVMKLVNS